jgi:hypothetical protein
MPNSVTCYSCGLQHMSCRTFPMLVLVHLLSRLALQAERPSATLPLFDKAEGLIRQLLLSSATTPYGPMAIDMAVLSFSRDEMFMESEECGTPLAVLGTPGSERLPPRSKRSAVAATSTERHHDSLHKIFVRQCCHLLPSSRMI